MRRVLDCMNFPEVSEVADNHLLSCSTRKITWDRSAKFLVLHPRKVTFQETKSNVQKKGIKKDNKKCIQFFQEVMWMDGWMKWATVSDNWCLSTFWTSFTFRFTCFRSLTRIISVTSGKWCRSLRRCRTSTLSSRMRCVITVFGLPKWQRRFGHARHPATLLSFCCFFHRNIHSFSFFQKLLFLFTSAWWIP